MYLVVNFRKTSQGYIAYPYNRKIAVSIKIGMQGIFYQNNIIRWCILLFFQPGRRIALYVIPLARILVLYYMLRTSGSNFKQSTEKTSVQRNIGKVLNVSFVCWTRVKRHRPTKIFILCSFKKFGWHYTVSMIYTQQKPCITKS